MTQAKIGRSLCSNGKKNDPRLKKQHRFPNIKGKNKIQNKQKTSLNACFLQKKSLNY